MIEVPRAEGTSSRIWLFRAEPQAPVLLVQPAMGMQARYYLPLAEALQAAGLTVALAELRGHELEGGRLPGRDYDFGYAELVEDLAAAVDVVQEHVPGAPVHLLGHSLGGQVALAYAASRPGRVAGLLVVGTCTVHWRSWTPLFLPVSQSFPVVARLLGYFPGRYVRFAGREARTMMRDWARFARTGRLPVADAALPTLDLPVLAVSIEGDRLSPARAVDALMAKLPRAQVTREHLAVEGIDHNRWARRPETVVPLFSSWLAAR